MKKRILSMALACIVAFGNGAADGAAVYAAAADPNESAVEQEDANAADEISDDGLEDVYDEQKVLEDVTIEGLDVSYETIEWGDASEDSQPRAAAAGRDHEIIMVLDVSGSMSGTPMTQLKKACYNFVDDILAEDSAAGIGIVTFESAVRAYTFGGEYFTSDRNQLRSVIKSLDALGMTAMNAGLSKADEIMESYGTASNKFIIQMADGSPNVGATYYGDDARYSGGPYTDPDGNQFDYGSDGYCSAIYNTFISIEKYYRIFSLGFFHSMSGTDRQFAATFMNDIQNTGYYEVEDADRLTFSFEDIAENINSDVMAFNKSSLVLSKDSREQLTISFSSAYTSTDKTVVWSSSDPAVAEVDEEGWVSAVGVGKCEIIAEAGGYKIVCPVTVAKNKPAKQISITIQQNENPQSEKNNNVVSEGAVITYDGEDFKTDAKGKVWIPEITEGEISISKAGFVTRTVPADYVKDGGTFVLQKASENPVISAVWVDGIDLLADEYEIDYNSTENKVFSADVTWSQSGRKRLQLAQEANYVDFTDNTLSLVLFQAGFDVTDDIYIIAEDNAGHVTKQKLQLVVPTNYFDGFELSFGDKIGVTLPDKFPLIGGSELGLDLKDGILPVSVAVNKRKVKVAIGFDVAQYSKKTTKDPNAKEEKDREKTEEEITNFVQEIKNIKKLKESVNSSSKELKERVKNVKKNWGDALTEKKGKFGVDAGFTITGYLEAYIDKDGKMQITEGGIVMLASAGVSWSGNFTFTVVVVPVPVYWEAAISGEVEAAFDVYYSGKNQEYTPGGSISAKLEGKVGGGLGHTSVATIGGGGKVNLSPKAQFYSDRENYFALTVGLSAYFKVTVAKFYEDTWEPDWAAAEFTWDNGVQSDRAGSADDSLTEDGLPKDMYDASAYSLANLDYILEPADSARAGATPEQSVSGNYAQPVLNFSANAFTQTSPKLVEFEDGTRLALWLDASTNDVNSVKVNYSYYDGAQWSQAAVVDSGSSTADLSFDVYSSGRNAYVVWQNASNRIDPEDKITNLKDVQVKAAILDSTGKFQKASVLNTNADVFTALPVVFGNGDNVTAAWVENTGTDWFLTEGTNTIYTSALLDGATWSQPQVFVDNLTAVTSLDGDMDDQGQTYLAYSVDQDNSLETSADQEIYVSNGLVTSKESNSNQEQPTVSGPNTVSGADVDDGQAAADNSDIADEQAAVGDVNIGNEQAMLEEGITDNQNIEEANSINEQAAVDNANISTQQVTVNDTSDTYVQFADHTLYWVRNGNVFYTNPTAIEEQAVLAAGQELLFQAYSIAGQGDNKAVLFSVKDELKSSIKGAFYQSGTNTWGNPIALTNPEDAVDITAFSATRINKNTIELLCNKTKVVGELIDGNKSSYDSLYGQTDLELIQYNGSCETSVEDSYYEREEIVADGALPVTLSVTNNDIEPISGVVVKVTDGINPVQEVDVAAQILSGCTEDITFNCEVKEEYIGRSLYLQCAPLENRDNVVPAGETSINLTYENIAQENLKWSYISKDRVSITADVKNLGFTKAEQVSASLHKGTPDSSALETVSLGAIDSMGTAEVSFEVPYEEDALYYVTLAVPENDENQADNTDFVVLKAQEDNTGRTLTSLSASLRKNSYTVGEKLDLSGLSVEAVYSDKTKSDVKAEAKIDTSKVNMSKAGTYTITISYGGKSAKVQVKVSSGNSNTNTVKKGAKVTVNKLNYTVTSAKGTNRTVTLTGCKNKSTRKTLTVPATITISKTKYNVTAVQAKAFSGCKKLTQVTIGSKVTSIGNQAFANCKVLKTVKCGVALKQIKTKAFSGCNKLSKITIKSKKLTKVGKNACKGIAAKAVIRVPASKLNAYQRLFSKKSVGYKKGWKIRK